MQAAVPEARYELGKTLYRMNLYQGALSQFGKIVETGQQTRVELAEGAGSILSNYPSRDDDLGREVNVGIRPEDMTPTEDEAYAYGGKVEIAESLGEVTVLYFEASQKGQDPVIAKLPGIHGEMRGRNVHMTADPGKVHLFADGISLLYR